MRPFKWFVTDVTARFRPSRSRTSDLWIVNTMESAAKVRSKKLAANKDRLNQLLAELEELCLESADVR
ncbi:hypothetical protein T08_11052 [Trichinella sp. T8]|nr:hypothetical protein T08_11052 [Trichinella sp. T8]